MKREILTDPNHLLREPAKPVDNFDMELQHLIDDMIETMRDSNGVGLAAPQVGESKEIIVCELAGEENQSKKKEVLYEPFPLTVVCNPKIISHGRNKCKMVEGCLSFPGTELVVERPQKIVMTGKDRYGKNIKIEADKLFGRVLQHEFDHLNSTLLIDHLKEIKVVFFASGDFALKPLEIMHTDKQYQVEAVYTTPNISRSRGKISDNNQIKRLSGKLKIKTYEVYSLNNDEIADQIKKHKADIGVVVDFGLKIPEKIINIFKYKVVNIHPSLLPKYRGPSPVTAAILNGDRQTGVSLMVIDQGIDTGPVLSQYRVKLSGRETAPILSAYLSELGATLLLDALPYYISGEIKGKNQRESKAIYTKIINKSDGEILSGDDATTIDRKIRAYQPWPGVYTIFKGQRVEICSAHLDKDKNLVIDTVKPAGKSTMTYQDFKNGYGQLTLPLNIDKIDSN